MLETAQQSAEQRYLDLLKVTLTDYLRVGNPMADAMPMRHVRPRTWVQRVAREALASFVRFCGFDLVRPSRVPAEDRREIRRKGLDWPPLGETMVGLERLDHLQTVIETILAEKVPGDLLEAGVWRGGASIFMQAVLTVHGARDRAVWLCDSFEGLPPPDPRYPADAETNFHEFSILAVSEEEVRSNFERYGLYADNLRFLRGYFEDSLAKAQVEQIALLRMDGDMYSSTTSILDALYEKVAEGGFVIVDDYNLDPCVQAVSDFREAQGISDPIARIDDSAVFWRKSASSGRTRSP